MSIDQLEVVAAYTNSRITVPALAAQFNIKPADAAAILRLNGIAIRKGNVSGANNLTPEARARGHAIRADKALRRILADLVERHGWADVSLALDDIRDKQSFTQSISFDANAQ